MSLMRSILILKMLYIQMRIQKVVNIMIKKKKRYIGNFIEEEEAAREYDKIAIQFHGPKAKTNFQYSKEEINSILSAPKLQKLSNLF